MKPFGSVGHQGQFAYLKRAKNFHDMDFVLNDIICVNNTFINVFGLRTS